MWVDVLNLSFLNTILHSSSTLSENEYQAIAEANMTSSDKNNAISE